MRKSGETMTINLTDPSNQLTDGQLLFRLQDFYGAEQDATKIGDYEFAQECADIVSVIREVQALRVSNAANFARVLELENELEVAQAELQRYRNNYHWREQLNEDE